MYKQIIPIAFCGIFMLSCGNKTAENDNKTSESNSETVNIKDIFKENGGENTQKLILNGEVVCDETKMGKIFTPFDAKCLQLNVQTGDKVRKNQVLAILQGEMSEQLAKEIKENEALLSVSVRKLQQCRQMYDAGVISEKELAEIEQENAVLKAEKQRLIKTSSLYGTSIKAPCDGYVVSKNIFQGSFVNKEDENPMFVIADISSVWILADVYAKDIHKIKENQPATVKITAFDDTVFNTKVDCIYPVLEKESKTLKIRLQIANKDKKLRPGMFANVIL
ncbi:MAG: efflux RND transporter periplasmic adaptor subunit [Bacteroidales bacterium]|nr:efflux RND transporter periplasmic adaptor subunit [Bacteroidales bacterium]